MSTPATEPSDTELMVGIARHDEHAFTLLYQRLAPLVFGLVLRRVRSHAEAEDVLQVVFWRVWEHAAARPQDTCVPRVWIFTIARNLSIDHLRSSWRDERGRARTRDFAAPNEAIHSRCGFANSARTETSTAVHQTLERLHPPERNAIKLSFFDGLTHEQIASATGAPVGTIKARIRRGIVKLKPPLSRMYQESRA